MKRMPRISGRASAPPRTEIEKRRRAGRSVALGEQRTPAALVRLAAGNRMLVRRLSAARSGSGRALARAPRGFRPAAIYSDWREAVGESKIRSALEAFIYEHTTHSDRGRTLEDEFEEALSYQLEHLRPPPGGGHPPDGARLLQWQRQLDREFRAVKASIEKMEWDDAIRHLDAAFHLATLIYALDLVAPEFDVTWKKQIVPGKITIRHTGPRVEALFEVLPAGASRAVAKNLNVSLRRHWWSGIDAGSVAAAEGNSLMGPDISLEVITNDIRSVAQQYQAHVAKRGYSGEFPATPPSGIRYFVNRLDNQQPHCFPTRGSKTAQLTSAEYRAAVTLKLYASAVQRNKRPPVGHGLTEARARVNEVGMGIFDKLTTIGVGFDAGLKKNLEPAR